MRCLYYSNVKTKKNRRSCETFITFKISTHLYNCDDCFHHLGPPLSNSEILTYSACLLSVTVFPTLLIHLTYFKSNKNQSIILFDNEMIIQTKNEREEIKYNEITNLKRVMTNNYAKKNIPFLPWENYHYFIVTTKFNQFIITSLLVDRLDEKISIDDDKITTELDFHLSSRHSKTFLHRIQLKIKF